MWMSFVLVNQDKTYFSYQKVNNLQHFINAAKSKQSSNFLICV